MSLLKTAAIQKKMQSKPKGQRLHYFFKGRTDLLTPKQILQVIKIVDDDHAKTKKFLEDAYPSFDGNK